jgi:hypothetical protein
MALVALLALALVSCTKRKPEEVDYAPDSPFNPYPPDSATNIDHTTLDVTLRWTATDPNSGDLLTYDVYLDTLNPPLVKIASGLTSPSYFLTGLSYNTTYYWKLYITDDKGVITSGPVWQFTTLPHANTAPTVPVYLYPADGASWLYPTLSLSWNCTDPEGSSDTLHYDLYLGVTLEPPIRLFRSDTSSTREMTGLNYATTYYWKVVVHDNHYAYTSGPVYSFTTRDCPWFYKRELPSPRYGFGTAVVNDKIYVIGGYDGFNYLSEVLEYNPASDAWTSKAKMPTPRSQLAVAVWNGKIYAMGGSRDIYDLRDNNEVYDPVLDSWSILAPLPASNYWATANALSGGIYLFGSTPVMGGNYGRVFYYSTDNGAWWDTTIYWPDTVWTDTTYTSYDSIRVCSLTTTVKSSIPSGKIFYCSALYGQNIYLLGGSAKNGEPSAGTDVYRPETNAWTTGSDMIGPASAPAATVANGFIYVVGGYDGTSSKRVRKYDPFSDAWFIRSDLQNERGFSGAAFIGANGRIYAFGGLSVVPLSTVEEYRLDLDTKYNSR